MKPTLTQKLQLVMTPEESRAARQALEQSDRSPFPLWCCQLFAWLIGEAEERREGNPEPQVKRERTP